MLNTEAYKQMIQALKTMKSMGPKYKFGVEIPRSVKHALELDAKNGNNLWFEAIIKELNQLDDFKTFRLRKPGESLKGYKRIPYHFVFDVKHDGRHKCRAVVGGKPL